MKRFFLAIRVFFRILFDRGLAGRVERVMLEDHLLKAAERPEPPPKAEQRPGRSDALTLLATLQREARLIDFLQEPLDSFSDAQIGSAVREVHRASREVLERLFGVSPLLADVEGAEVQVPAGFDAFRFRLSGNVGDAPPYRGRVTHRGWEAAKCDLPRWTGDESAARVLAPAEVEVS